MNGVTVPARYKYLTQRERLKTEDYKDKVKYFIEARPQQAITSADFIEALNTTSAMAHIKRLEKQGHIERMRLHKGRGKRYSYKWHDSPLDPEEAITRNGYVLSKGLDIPQFALEGKLEAVQTLFAQWAVRQLPQGERMAGVAEFINWLQRQQKEVNEQRKAILEGKQ